MRRISERRLTRLEFEVGSHDPHHPLIDMVEEIRALRKLEEAVRARGELPETAGEMGIREELAKIPELKEE